ncbi:hypothetical protein K0M31_005294 [Melipona bicolor]|uniref:Uncharacterized protein n=1 Tax=Melipona bicolor TaxID=60889 RepID=A0AA40KMA4_9HYME|nr:hypothetical protein K0M31_005294 [Melipona bicolor]
MTESVCTYSSSFRFTFPRPDSNNDPGIGRRSSNGKVFRHVFTWNINQRSYSGYFEWPMNVSHLPFSCRSEEVARAERISLIDAPENEEFERRNLEKRSETNDKD